jgi:hypothetical protein
MKSLTLSACALIWRLFGIKGGIDGFGTCRRIGQRECSDAACRPLHGVGDVAPLLGIAGLDDAFELAHQFGGLPHEQGEDLRIQRSVSARVAGKMGHIDRTRLHSRHRQNPMKAVGIVMADPSRRR